MCAEQTEREPSRESLKIVRLVIEGNLDKKIRVERNKSFQKIRTNILQDMMSSSVEQKITKNVPIVCGSQVKGSNK